ncbi:MAG: hypothetical protein K2Y28_05695 [Burkholderiaceae bacterium]|nr:hypothetical protein [Burkholderiaceae bacterium]
MSQEISEIGGYFGLQLPPLEEASHYVASPFLRRFQSARASLFALLREVNPPSIWLPKFLCDSMIDAALTHGSEVKYYDLTNNLCVNEDVELKPGELLLFVNYFGLCAAAQKDAIERFGAENIILDHSQAFFDGIDNVFAVIKSPRKFFPLPDGGLLFSRELTGRIYDKDIDSIKRMNHLLQRTAFNAKKGYSSYIEAEKSLNNCAPLEMSNLTQCMLEACDFSRARLKRNENFLLLHDALKDLNQFPIMFNEIDGPLCYPLMVSNENLRKNLIDENVFIPIYWNEVLRRVTPTSIEAKLVNDCIAIPCDQRYGQNQMLYLTKLIKGKMR